jgi:chorismate synthase
MDYRIFGESHGEEIGAVINGLPAGVEINLDFIASELLRRAGGNDETSTSRKEPDNFRIISGIASGKTTGAPLCVIIPNENVRSSDYTEMAQKMRPSHSDYGAFIKFGGHNDYRGGGHFSGRLTAPLVAIGAIAKQALKDIVITSNVISPTREEALLAKEEGDSVGGTIEVVAYDVPAGLGGYNLDGIESVLAPHFFAIPAVKAVEFGAGVEFAKMRGSEANDAYAIENGNVTTTTNHCGGIVGGITTGMPIVARLTFKPTPSIGKEQNTIECNNGVFKETTLEVKGRHDPCIVFRAAVVTESVMALALGGLLWT